MQPERRIAATQAQAIEARAGKRRSVMRSIPVAPFANCLAGPLQRRAVFLPPQQVRRRAMRWFSDRHRRERAAAERIYAASVAAARRPQLYLALGVPDTLQGRFEMVALHLF